MGGYGEGFLRHQMDLEDVERKLELCQEVLNVVGTLDPGMTDWRGSMIYEGNWPAMMLLQKSLSNKQINRKQFQRKVKQLLKQLEIAGRCLSLECEGRYEKEIEKRAQQAVESMKKLL